VPEVTTVDNEANSTVQLEPETGTEPDSGDVDAKPSEPNAPVKKPSTVRTSTFDFYTLTNLETKGEVSSVPYAHSSGSCIIGVDTSKGADGKVYILSNLNCGLRDSIGVGKDELPVGPARSLEGWFIGNTGNVSNIRAASKPAVFSAVGCDVYGSISVSRDQISVNCGISSIKTQLQYVFKKLRSEQVTFDTGGL
jgi:hypothetical protein